jgi:hypothetical protein
MYMCKIYDDTKNGEESACMTETEQVLRLISMAARNTEDITQFLQPENYPC